MWLRLSLRSALSNWFSNCFPECSKPGIHRSSTDFSSSAPRLAHSDHLTTGPLVHVDINDTAIQQLKTYYLTRSQYARVIRNLAGMRVAAQAYDLIFAAGTNQADDQAIIGATREAGNVYFGMALALGSRSDARSGAIAPEIREYLDHTKWDVKVEGRRRISIPGRSRSSLFRLLQKFPKGIGFLSLQTDRDGVIRRVPLLVRYEGGFYPSLPFRLVCGYLGVGPEKITIKPRQLYPAGGRKSRPEARPATSSSRSTTTAR